MKLLFLIHQFYPSCQYGAENYAYHLAHGLRSLGHDMHVFHRENHTPRAFKPSERLQEEEIQVGDLTVHRVFLNPKYTLNLGPAFHYLSTFYNPPIERAFERYLDTLQPDLIHVHHLLYLSGGLMSIAKQRNIPIVVTLHDFWYFCPNAQLLRPTGQVCVENPGKIHCGKCMKALYGGHIPDALLALGGPFFQWQERYLRRAMSKACILIAPSQFLLERYVEAGYPREKLVFLDNCFPKIVLGRRSETPKVNVPVRVGYIGSLTPHKGVHVLIQAFEQIDPAMATLDVYGSAEAFPEYSASLLELAADASGIRFQGAFEHSQVVEVLGQLDLLVVPSLWYENSPLVIREAFSAGVPVIASRIGALPEKVHEGEYGLLFEPGDAEDLARLLSQVLADQNQINQLKQNLQAFNHDMGVHLESILDIYRHSIGRIGLAK
jgi:glycosyltransferase involved in cell wall biosynthesis